MAVTILEYRLSSSVWRFGCQANRRVYSPRRLIVKMYKKKSKNQQQRRTDNNIFFVHWPNTQWVIFQFKNNMNTLLHALIHVSTKKRRKKHTFNWRCYFVKFSKKRSSERQNKKKKRKKNRKQQTRAQLPNGRLQCRIQMRVFISVLQNNDKRERERSKNIVMILIHSNQCYYLKELKLFCIW